jgi:hypothetical protein
MAKISYTKPFQSYQAQIALLKYPNVDSRAMGFPAQWQTEPLWR